MRKDASQLHRGLSNHLASPHSATYDVSANSVRRHMPLKSLEGSPKPSRLRQASFFVLKHSDTVETDSNIAGRVRLHLKSPISFDLQLSRPEPASPSAHEGRFDHPTVYPPISTLHRRVVSPNFSRALSRKKQKRHDSPKHEYSPNIEVVKCHAGLGSPKWRSKQGRKAASIKANDLTYNVKFNYVDRQVSVPLFDKNSSRPHSDLEKLPSFMCSTNSRLDLRLINDRSLKMSKFADLDYYLPISSFSKAERKSGKASPQPNAC